MIVVDNSILVSALVETGKTAKAKQVAAGDRQWILPPLWRFEFTNVLATLSRKLMLDMRMARIVLDEARTLVAAREVPVDQAEVIRFAIMLSISGYDAQYIALADAYGIQCVTDDRQLVQRAPNHAILLEDFVE